MKNKRFTTQEILRAAEIGEVSMNDARYIISLLDEARTAINKGFECRTCEHKYTNPFNQEYCKKDYDIENGKDCHGRMYETKNKQGIFRPRSGLK
jgi:hypothetical protein